MDFNDDQWTYAYDALAEDGLENDSQAWQALDRVRELLHAYGRYIGARPKQHRCPGEAGRRSGGWGYISGADLYNAECAASPVPQRR
ncbi:hypothetical protein [Gordonia zhaorongruii]|uniref:hypothetical protein n=1 Tax=Gordonia zhaorongruii TaxID=2597659 RepID=UPI0010478D08|nr:hypothetical protein [Gordonia zhaorongruii]